MGNDLSRRNFLQGALVGAAGLAAAGVLNGCEATPSSESETATGNSSLYADDLFEESRVVRNSIPDSEIEETYDYDVVVIGAGTAGVTAAVAAAENGAGRVAVLQNAAECVSQGNMGSGLLLDESDQVGLARFKQEWNELYCYASDQFLVDNYLKYSGAAAQLIVDKATEAGFPPRISPDVIEYEDGHKVTSLRVLFDPKPTNYADGLKAIASLGSEMGIDFYYNMPGVQLVQDDAGKVTGAIGENQTSSTYAKFNASKGVILATGCFSNNQSMLQRYCPDVLGFICKVTGHFGDGHLLGVLAGGVLKNGTYTKMAHDNDAGPLQDAPFLGVTDAGERFFNEEVDSTLWNNLLKDFPQKGWFSHIFDSDFIETATAWGIRRIPAIEDMEAYIPGTDACLEKGVFADFCHTYKADTLEELAELLGIDGDNLVKTVARYNEICEKGIDEDFGKKAKYLAPIKTPPFWGIHRNTRLSTILSGLEVNANMQVTDVTGEPIPGLYAAGNCAGRPGAGASDWRQVAYGESLGFAFTGGYVAGCAIAGAL